MDLTELYQDLILDHGKKPRNFGKCNKFNHDAVGHNPLCGDEITIYAQVENGILTDIKVSGQGCSISQSSASMMSQAVKGKSLAEVQALVHRFKVMMSIAEDPEDGPLVEVKLGDLEALQGVVKFPVRIKCAVLSWNTLLQALQEAS